MSRLRKQSLSNHQWHGTCCAFLSVVQDGWRNAVLAEWRRLSEFAKLRLTMLGVAGTTKNPKIAAMTSLAARDVYDVLLGACNAMTGKDR